MVIKEFLNRFSAKKERFKELENESRMAEMVQQKRKSSNERELEKLQERDRQEAISEELKRRRKAETREMFSGDIFKSKNVFQGHKRVLSQDKNIMHNGNHQNFGRSIFMQRGIL